MPPLSTQQSRSDHPECSKNCLQVGREIRFALQEQPALRSFGRPNRVPSPRLKGFNPVTASGLSPFYTSLASGLMIVLEEKVGNLNYSLVKKDSACSLAYPRNAVVSISVQQL
ncbi:hypothetical protein NQZ68_023129 [Dissostichus eleginoides]|uniref:ATP synthase gamma chain n=1 Tax=Dissostichus eleginoides TaxID=100907 RepID=A0AAD9F554_DISEL|nr:hypothetical protein NQZ68_023129 [Dissostichus eleginoides]KAK1889342.1 ATP synthase gamma chain [Dissostichus eleginoides]